MIETQTTRPALAIRVYAQWEIESIDAPEERFVTVSITDSDRRASRANLKHLEAAPLLRLSFHVGGPPRGLTDEQAVQFWTFIKSHLEGLDTIKLHCGAGQIRSPALALALVQAFHGDEGLLLSDSEPDETTYLAAVQAYPKVFGRPFPEAED